MLTRNLLDFDLIMQLDSRGQTFFYDRIWPQTKVTALQDLRRTPPAQALQLKPTDECTIAYAFSLACVFLLRQGPTRDISAGLTHNMDKKRIPNLCDYGQQYAHGHSQLAGLPSIDPARC